MVFLPTLALNKAVPSGLWPLGTVWGKACAGRIRAWQACCPFGLRESCGYQKIT
jgi:hypothetical protein